MASQEIEDLKNYYNSFNVVSRFLLFPSLRGAPLDDTPPLLIFEMANTPYFKAVSEFFDRFVASPLSFFSKPRVLAWQKLQENNVLSGDNAKENFDAIAGHQKPKNVAEARIILHEAGLLDPTNPAFLRTNIDIVEGHQDPESYARGHVILHKAGLLDPTKPVFMQANVDAVGGHQDPAIAAYGLVMLHKTGLLDPTQPERANANLAYLENVWGIKRFGLLDFDNPDFVQAIFDVAKTVNANQDDRLLRVLNHLKMVGLLDPKNLARANANLDAATAQHHDALSTLAAFGLLDAYNPEAAQACFDKLIQYSEILIDSENGRKAWSNMRNRILTQTHWNVILDLCEKNKENPALGAHEFAEYVEKNMPRVNESKVKKASKAAQLDCQSRAYHAGETLEGAREVNPEVASNNISQDNTVGGDKPTPRDIDTESAKKALQELREKKDEHFGPKFK
jgi:tetratricopeptide (TPR) repeat protein